jgi:UDP-glucuronate 4-epimerase
MTTVLITGAAGFIGSTLALHLAAQGHTVLACDWSNVQGDTPLDPDLQDVPARLRRDRLVRLAAHPQIRYHCLDITQPGAVLTLIGDSRVEAVVHLAAQAGVRQSVLAPMDFVGPNLVAKIQRFLYASSSSVYGLRDDAPFQEDDRTDRPQSFYAATKLANEAMACAYHAQYGMASLGMRFFTVYGPWGRPDMAPLMFARKLLKGETLRLFAKGELHRDFTYVGDTVAAIDRLLHRPQGDAAAEVVNVGHRRPVQVKAFVEILARLTDTVPVIEFAPMQVADVTLTCASEDRLLSMIGSWPDTPLEQGLKSLVDWLQAWEFGRGQPG